MRRAGRRCCIRVFIAGLVSWRNSVCEELLAILRTMLCISMHPLCDPRTLQTHRITAVRSTTPPVDNCLLYVFLYVLGAQSNVALYKSRLVS